jgi:hypothetical protein
MLIVDLCWIKKNFNNQHTKFLGASIYMIVFFSFNDVILLCKLQRDLQQKQAEQIVRNMLHNIIDGIKIQDRPPSPLVVDFLIFFSFC